jgi:hypothetical protein
MGGGVHEILPVSRATVPSHGLVAGLQLPGDEASHRSIPLPQSSCRRQFFEEGRNPAKISTSQLFSICARMRSSMKRGGWQIRFYLGAFTFM